jgi:hypothetical protein
MVLFIALSSLTNFADHTCVVEYRRHATVVGSADADHAAAKLASRGEDVASRAE